MLSSVTIILLVSLISNAAGKKTLLVPLTSIAAEKPADCSWKLTDCQTRSKQEGLYENCYMKTSGEFDLCESLCTFNNYDCENYCPEFMELCMKPKQSTTTLTHTKSSHALPSSHANESLATPAINESVVHASPKHRPAVESGIPVGIICIIAFLLLLGFHPNTFKRRVSLKACRRSPTGGKNGTELNAKRPNVEGDDGGSQTTITVIDEQSAKKKKLVRPKNNRVSANLSSGDESMGMANLLSRQGVDNSAHSEIPPMGNGKPQVTSSDDNLTRNEDDALLGDGSGEER